MTTVYVKPVNGAKVRDPLTLDFVPEAGRNVVLTTYWRKKIMQGYLAIVDEPLTEKDETNVDLV